MRRDVAVEAAPEGGVGAFEGCGTPEGTSGVSTCGSLPDGRPKLSYYLPRPWYVTVQQPQIAICWPRI